MDDLINVKGYDNLFFDPGTDCYILYLNNDRTFIEVCGEDRENVIKSIHSHLLPPSPADVKTIY